VDGFTQHVLLIAVEEILNFGQADLVTEDVMLLDVEDTLFVWLGHESNDTERRACIATAREYLDSDPSGRDKDLPIVVVKQGCEPPSFTGFFGAWDLELFKVCPLTSATTSLGVIAPSL
jgi:hypothetical protein